MFRSVGRFLSFASCTAMLAACQSTSPAPPIGPSTVLLENTNLDGFGIVLSGRNYIVVGSEEVSSQYAIPDRPSPAGAELLNCNICGQGLRVYDTEVVINGETKTAAMILDTYTDNVILFGVSGAYGAFGSPPFSIPLGGDVVYAGMAYLTSRTNDTSYVNVPMTLELNLGSGAASLEVGYSDPNSIPYSFTDSFTVDMATGKFSSATGVGKTTAQGSGCCTILNTESVYTYGSITGEGAGGVIGVFAWDYDGVVGSGPFGEEIFGTFMGRR